MQASTLKPQQAPETCCDLPLTWKERKFIMYAAKMTRCKNCGTRYEQGLDTQQVYVQPGEEDPTHYQCGALVGIVAVPRNVVRGNTIRGLEETIPYCTKCEVAPALDNGPGKLLKGYIICRDA